MSTLYNTYQNHKGQTLPKCPIVPNTPEIREYLLNNYSWQWKNSASFIKNDSKWLIVSISASHAGYIYYSFSTITDKDLEMYDNSAIKIFTNDEPFKKYLTWALNISRKIVNSK